MMGGGGEGGLGIGAGGTDPLSFEVGLLLDNEQTNQQDL